MARRATKTTKRGATIRSSGLGPVLAEFTRQTALSRNWGHAGLDTILRGVTPEEAAWKPWPDGHSIWEEVNHILHWSKDVLEVLEGRGQARPQAWPAGGSSPDEWRRAVGQARKLHAGLVRRINGTAPALLARRPPKSRFSHAQRILGGASHIAYHAGRVALLRRMYQHAHQPASA
jgi:hypothetical protein